MFREAGLVPTRFGRRHVNRASSETGALGAHLQAGVAVVGGQEWKRMRAIDNLWDFGTNIRAKRYGCGTIKGIPVRTRRVRLVRGGSLPTLLIYRSTLP
jgi:hypothetical protein